MAPLRLHAVNFAAPLTWQDRLSITTDIVQGLTHLHGRGIYIREIRPESITIDRFTGAAKLCDVGLPALKLAALGILDYTDNPTQSGSYASATLLSSSPPAGHPTAKPALAADEENAPQHNNLLYPSDNCTADSDARTPYLAPECRQPGYVLSPSADIYSLGEGNEVVASIVTALSTAAGAAGKATSLTVSDDLGDALDAAAQAIVKVAGGDRRNAGPDDATDTSYKVVQEVSHDDQPAAGAGAGAGADPVQRTVSGQVAGVGAAHEVDSLCTTSATIAVTALAAEFQFAVASAGTGAKSNQQHSACSAPDVATGSQACSAAQHNGQKLAAADLHTAEGEYQTAGAAAALAAYGAGTHAAGAQDSISTNRGLPCSVAPDVVQALASNATVTVTAERVDLAASSGKGTGAAKAKCTPVRRSPRVSRFDDHHPHAQHADLQLRPSQLQATVVFSLHD
eukprot:gene6344-6578_t